MLSAEQVQAAIAAIESGDAEAMKAVLTDILAAMASGEAPDESESTDAPADDAPANAQEPPDEEANAVIRSLQETVNGLLAEKESRELDERRGLIAELVKLGVETPATAWSGKPEARMPCKRLASEPVAELRSRVAAMAAVRGVNVGSVPAGAKPPAKGPELSKKELEACRKRGIDPQEFAARKAAAVRTREVKP